MLMLMLIRIIRALVVAGVCAILLPNIFSETGTYHNYRGAAPACIATVRSAFRQLAAEHGGKLTSRTYKGKAGEPVDCQTLGLDATQLDGPEFDASRVMLDRLDREHGRVALSIQPEHDDWIVTSDENGTLGGPFFEAEARNRSWTIGLICGLGVLAFLVPVRRRRTEVTAAGPVTEAAADEAAG